MGVHKLLAFLRKFFTDVLEKCCTVSFKAMLEGFYSKHLRPLYIVVDSHVWLVRIPNYS